MYHSEPNDLVFKSSFIKYARVYFIAILRVEERSLCKYVTAKFQSENFESCVWSDSVPKTTITV